MSLYLNQIYQLVSLQRVDDAIYIVEEELKQAPQELENLASRFESANSQRDIIFEKLEHLKEQEKRIHQEIEGDEGRIKKSKGKLMQVSNSREYQAMAREMDNMERLNRNREEEKNALLDEKQLQENTLIEIEKLWASLKDELAQKQAGLDDYMQNAQNRLAELEKTRILNTKEIPWPVLERYEFIRRRLAHPVIVPVTNGVCGGCHIVVPPQTYIELQGGDKIFNCPNCQRLVYWSEHFSEKDRFQQKINDTEDNSQKVEELINE